MNDVTAAIEHLSAWAEQSPVRMIDADPKVWARVVLAEVERLRADRTTMRIDFEHVVDERDGLLAQMADVATLHFETDGVHTHTVCAHRYCVDDSHDQHQWPCPTAIAAGLA